MGSLYKRSGSSKNLLMDWMWWVREREGSRMTSHFPAIVTEWQMVPFMGIGKIREEQVRANRKMRL